MVGQIQPVLTDGLTDAVKVCFTHCEGRCQLPIVRANPLAPRGAPMHHVRRLHDRSGQHLSALDAAPVPATLNAVRLVGACLACAAQPFESLSTLARRCRDSRAGPIRPDRCDSAGGGTCGAPVCRSWALCTAALDTLSLEIPRLCTAVLDTLSLEIPRRTSSKASAHHGHHGSSFRGHGEISYFNVPLLWRLLPFLWAWPAWERGGQLRPFGT